MNRSGRLTVAMTLAAACIGCQALKFSPQTKTCPPVREVSVSPAPAREVIVCPEPAKPEISEIELALAFHERMRSLQAPALAEQIAAAKQRFESDSSDLNRLQYALLMTLGGAGARNNDAILELLLPLTTIEKRGKSSLRTVAILLHSEIAENRRLGDTVRQQTSKLKDESRRNDALQHKLDALLQMEKTIMEREQPPPETRR
ncbi:MAG: hypothetical protein ABL878_08625 [Burkholderiales bacterium]